MYYDNSPLNRYAYAYYSVPFYDGICGIKIQGSYSYITAYYTTDSNISNAFYSFNPTYFEPSSTIIQVGLSINPLPDILSPFYPQGATLDNLGSFRGLYTYQPIGNVFSYIIDQSAIAATYNLYYTDITFMNDTSTTDIFGPCLILPLMPLSGVTFSSPAIDQISSTTYSKLSSFSINLSNTLVKNISFQTDLNNTYPRLYYGGTLTEISYIPKLLNSTFSEIRLNGGLTSNVCVGYGNFIYYYNGTTVNSMDINGNVTTLFTPTKNPITSLGLTNDGKYLLAVVPGVNFNYSAPLKNNQSVQTYIPNFSVFPSRSFPNSPISGGLGSTNPTPQFPSLYMIPGGNQSSGIYRFNLTSLVLEYFPFNGFLNPINGIPNRPDYIDLQSSLTQFSQNGIYTPYYGYICGSINNTKGNIIVNSSDSITVSGQIYALAYIIYCQINNPYGTQVVNFFYTYYNIPYFDGLCTISLPSPDVSGYAYMKMASYNLTNFNSNWPPSTSQIQVNGNYQNIINDIPSIYNPQGLTLNVAAKDSYGLYTYGTPVNSILINNNTTITTFQSKLYTDILYVDDTSNKNLVGQGLFFPSMPTPGAIETIPRMIQLNPLNFNLMSQFVFATYPSDTNVKSLSYSINPLTSYTRFYYDAFLTKIYDTVNGASTGAEPHVYPIIGGHYLLDNDKKYFKYFDNKKDTIINAYCDILNDEQIDKYSKEYPYINFQYLKTYTFNRQIEVIYNDEYVIFDMDGLNIIKNNELKNIEISEITICEEGMFEYASQKLVKIGDTYKRTIKINNSEKVKFDILFAERHLDRNWLFIEFITENELNKNDFEGALIYEADWSIEKLTNI